MDSPLDRIHIALSDRLPRILVIPDISKATDLGDALEPVIFHPPEEVLLEVGVAVELGPQLVVGLLELGVVPLGNMLPETAYMKLAWAIGLHPDDPKAVRELMTTTLAGEMTEGEPHEGYLILQGGVPEVQDFLRSIWK